MMPGAEWNAAALQDALDTVLEAFLRVPEHRHKGSSTTTVLELIMWNGARSRLDAKLQANADYGRSVRPPTLVTDEARLREIDARSAYPAVLQALEEESAGSEQELERDARALIRRQAAGVDGLDWDRRVLALALRLQQSSAHLEEGS